jgi:hypothetical protein
MKMSQTVYERRKLSIENRIRILTERGTSSSIINKLHRQLRKLEVEYAAQQETAE